MCCRKKWIQNWCTADRDCPNWSWKLAFFEPIQKLNAQNVDYGNHIINTNNRNIRTNDIIINSSVKNAKYFTIAE